MFDGIFDKTVLPGWFDWFALVVTLIGLFFAWKQSSQAKDAAESARDAVASTESKLTLNQLLLVLSSVQSVVADIDNYSKSESSDITIFSLSRFGFLATEAAELMEKHQMDYGELPEKLRGASQQALDVKAALSKTTSLKVSTFTRDLQGHLGRLNLEITTAMTRLRFTTGDDDV